MCGNYLVDDLQDYIETFEGEFDNPYLIAVLSDVINQFVQFQDMVIL